MGRRFQFNLELPFVLLAGMMAGGQTARYLALSETPMLAGKPVAWSVRGEVVFFTIGCLASSLGLIGAGIALSQVQIRTRWRFRNERQKIFVLLIGGIVVGAGSGFFGLPAMGLIFFAGPREVFDFITTKP